MNRPRPNKSLWLLASLSALALAGCSDKAPPAAAQLAKPALTVTVTTPQLVDWPQTLSASGNVAAWQEAVIGPEISNYRITEVRANVGDVVKQGDVLARIASDAVDSELAEIRATVAEAEATLAEARANNERARQLREKGFYSAQQGIQTQTAAETALARLNAAKARLHSAELRRSKASVVAPDDGIISARNATVGSLTQSGEELFRLIRGGRLEWRAEVTAGELARLQPGQPVKLESPNGIAVSGTVRAVAPTVDPQTRNGIVYVDLPPEAGKALSAGMFTRGEFELGQRPALTLPQSAVLLREGFAYVFRIEPGPDNTAKVVQTKVGTGRRDGEQHIEVTGLDAGAQVVASGAGFLADGDTVRIVAAPPASRRQSAAMNVSAWSIRNPIPAVLMFVMLTLLGAMAFKAMKIQQFPDIDLPTVTVTASLPGAAPAQMETEVARKIENSVATLQGIKHIYTKVQDGTAIVTVEFRLEKPTQEALDDVRDAVSRVRADLPGDLKDPVISKVNLAGAPILTYTIASTRMDDEALSWFVDNTVSKALLSVRGVGAVARVGGVTREIRIELDPGSPARAARHGGRHFAPVAADPAGRLGRPRRCRRRRTVGAHHRHRAVGRGTGADGDFPRRRPAGSPRPAGDGQRHRHRAALGGPAQRQAGGRLRDRPQPRRRRGRCHQRRARRAGKAEEGLPGHHDHRGLQFRRSGAGKLRGLDGAADRGRHPRRHRRLALPARLARHLRLGHRAAAVDHPDLRRHVPDGLLAQRRHAAVDVAGGRHIGG